VKGLALLVLLPFAASAATYEMADLKALESQQGWRELVDHLADIVPSKRDAEWKGLAERSLTALLDTLEVKDERKAQETLNTIDEQLKRWAWLKQSKPFLARRADVGLKAFAATFGSSRHSAGDDPWRERLKEFVAVDPITADLPLRAGKLITSRLVADAAIPFFRSAMAKTGKTLCKDADVQKALVASWLEATYRDDAAAMTDTCFDELKPLLIAELPKASFSARKNSLCPYLLAKKLVPEDQKSKCVFE
jgi:hypothetical protein